MQVLHVRESGREAEDSQPGQLRAIFKAQVQSYQLPPQGAQGLMTN